MTEENPLLPRQAAAAERDRQIRERMGTEAKCELDELRWMLSRDCKACNATLALAGDLCDKHKHLRSRDELWDEERTRRRPRRRPDPVERVRRLLGG